LFYLFNLVYLLKGCRQVCYGPAIKDCCSCSLATWIYHNTRLQQKLWANEIRNWGFNV